MSRTFTELTDIMFVRMKLLVFWPENLLSPMQLRQHFGAECAVIIDRFDIVIEPPSNVKARVETSSYKHLNTVKFLL